ncbi:MAG: hypothetical protein ABJA57_07800 [Ginsengibacter sp.]
MKTFRFNTTKTLFLVSLSLVLLSFNFLRVNLETRPKYDKREFFDPSLGDLNSIEKLSFYLDSIASKNNINPQSVQYAVLTEKIIKNRFYHGFSHYDLKQNWVAAFSEKLVGYGLSSIVLPDDIIQHPYAACSQQALVMTAVLKRKGFSYRSVGFPHHYAMEFLIDKKWYYFDPDMEPVIPDSCRLEMKWGCLSENLKKYYDTGRFHQLDWQFGSLPVKLGKINAQQAPNAGIFQSVTFYLSRILWLFPIMIVFYHQRRSPGKVE